MRKGYIYKHGKLAGELLETESGSMIFSYDSAWLRDETEWLSLTLPYDLYPSATETKNIPQFFEGLIPEGWLLDIAYKIKPDLVKDRFGLLLAVAKDCIGSVSILPNRLIGSGIDNNELERTEEFSRKILRARENKFGRCLVCMDKIDERHEFYHKSCAKKLFGSSDELIYPYFQEEFENLAEQNIKARLTIPGAQRKISASITADNGKFSRITIVGSGEYGLFILKPEHPLVPTFPANEHLAMSLARVAGIPTADFGLVVGPDEKLAYITKRFDRELNEGRLEKRSMEDFGQLFGRIRDSDKYKESYDKIGKYLNARSAKKLVDVARFFDQVFLSYLIGNNDFHLRNLSVFTDNNIPTLTPAYDITITQLIDSEPNEDTTLPVNGKKNDIRNRDWMEFGERIGINRKATEIKLKRFEKMMPKFIEEIEKSILPGSQKTILIRFVTNRLERAINSSIKIYT